jgi:hypothetical protein
MRIQAMVGSGLLRCGCIVGVYRRDDGSGVAIVGERGPGCTDADHRAGGEVSAGRPGVAGPRRGVVCGLVPRTATAP